MVALSTFDPDTEFGDAAAPAPTRPERAPQPEADGAGRLLQIPLAWLVPDAGNERGPLDPADPGLLALADSIKRHGVREPLHVFPAPARTGGRTRQQYFIQSGHRRYAAATMADLATVPCIVKDAPAGALGAAEGRLLANAHRQDLNPVEWGRGFQALAALGMKQEQIAAEFGISQGEVSNHLRLLALEPEILELVAAGKLSKSHARELLRVPDDFEEWAWQGRTNKTATQFRLEIAQWAATGEYSVPRLAERINQDLESSRYHRKATAERLQAEERRKIDAEAARIKKRLAEQNASPEEQAAMQERLDKAEAQRLEAEELQRKEQQKVRNLQEREALRRRERSEIAIQTVDRVLGDHNWSLETARIAARMALAGTHLGNYNSRYTGPETIALLEQAIDDALTTDDLLDVLSRIGRLGVHVDLEGRELGAPGDWTFNKWLDRVYCFNWEIAHALLFAGKINKVSFTALLGNAQPKRQTMAEAFATQEAVDAALARKSGATANSDEAEGPKF